MPKDVTYFSLQIPVPLLFPPEYQPLKGATVALTRPPVFTDQPQQFGVNPDVEPPEGIRFHALLVAA